MVEDKDQEQKKEKEEDKSIPDCKFRYKMFDYTPANCRRHAPIAIPNPEYDGFKGDTTKPIILTEYPIAQCPCGDYKPKDKMLTENKSKIPRGAAGGLIRGC